VPVFDDLIEIETIRLRSRFFADELASYGVVQRSAAGSGMPEC
jgi:hypothetical protein